jgi:outer membrane protein
MTPPVRYRMVVCIPAILCCLFVPATGGAQRQAMTIDQAVSIALERNRTVLQSSYQIESADATERAAWGNYLPSLSASGGWTRTQSSRLANQTVNVPGIGPTVTQAEFFGVTNQFNTGVSANYTLFDGLSREAGMNTATAQLTVAQMNSRRTRQSVVYQVVSGYLNILRTERLVTVAEENLKRDERQLERITESSRVGALSQADVYRQQSQVASDELDLINTQNAYAKAKVDLVALVGVDPTMEYDFSDSSVVADIDTARAVAFLAQYRDLKQATGRALTARPDYVAVKASLDAASSSVTGAKGSYFPSIGAFAGYGNFGEDLSTLSLTRNYYVNWGLDFRWNLFDGFLREQRVEDALVNERSAQVEMEQTEKNITVEVRKALLDLEAAKKSWDVSDKALRSATEDRRIAEERYNLGAGTLLDLLVANANFVGAQVSRVNAITGFLIAKHTMEFTLGERVY